MNVIEPAQAEWASPIVFVPKNDRTFQFFVDCRRFNAVTNWDSYRSPCMDECIYFSGDANFFSILYNNNGYMQIEVDKTDREEAAFTSYQGLYQLTRMPFGLKNQMVFSWVGNVPTCHGYNFIQHWTAVRSSLFWRYRYLLQDTTGTHSTHNDGFETSQGSCCNAEAHEVCFIYKSHWLPGSCNQTLSTRGRLLHSRRYTRTRAVYNSCRFTIILGTM